MKSCTKSLSFILICFILCISLIVLPTTETDATNENSLKERDAMLRLSDWSKHTQKYSTNLTREKSQDENIKTSLTTQNESCIEYPIHGLMNSSWPMVLHDVRHTGQSPLSTADNQGAELWRVQSDWAGTVESSAVIDKNNIIYFGTKGCQFFALHPNGTVKWRFQTNGLIWSTPAIAENGTIYVPTWGGYPPYLYALSPNGTLKWTFGLYTTSSPVIGDDGTIYIGDDNQYFHAINPNGTEKWQYTTGNFIQSSPAIADDGTIYVGSADTYLYAFYPNGTLRWRFKTGGWIKSDPSIGVDGTIYVPAFDGNLYAINPNGTLKWSADAGNEVIPRAVAIATDGTLYVGTEALRAFYPSNGSVKWTCNVGGQMYGTFPAISADGTIYVSADGSLVAVNPDGTERWRKQLTIAQIQSSPCIGTDDRVYVGSEDYGAMAYGYLHAFGIGPLRAEAGGPYGGAMTQPLQFNSEAFGGTPPYTTYHWDFGDNNTSDEQNPKHIYAHRGNYTATLAVTDSQGNQSQDTANVTIGYPLPQVSFVKPQNYVYFFNIRLFSWRWPVVFGPILLQVEASQVDGVGIDHVEFYDEGTLIKTDNLSPYDCFWNAHPPPVLHHIMVRVYDTRGNQNSTTIYPNKWF
jgi:outer membrane protein assembly factor BamB